MAPINQPLPANDPANTFGFSRGRSSQKADTSLSVLFEGLTETAGLGAGLADQVIQNEIRRDITSATDDIRSEFVDPNLTVSAATGLPESPNPTSPTPPEVEDAQRRLQTLRKAFDQKKISETSYYSQILSEVRRVRSRFPGYREIIDNVTRDVVGTDPANAIARNVFREANQRGSAAQAQALRNENDVRNLQERGLVRTHEVNAWRQGDLSIEELFSRVGEREQKVRFAENEKKRLAYENEYRGRDLKAVASIRMQEASRHVLAQLGYENSPEFGVLLFNAAKSGKSDPETVKTLRVAANAITVAHQNVIDDLKRKNPDLPSEVLQELQAMVDSRASAYARAIGDDRLQGIAAMESLYMEDLDNKGLREYKGNLTSRQRVFWTLLENNNSAAQTIFQLNRAEQHSLEKGFPRALDAAGKAIVEKRNMSDVLRELDEELEVNDVQPSVAPEIKGSVIEGSIANAADKPEEAEEDFNVLMPPREGAFNGIHPNSWRAYYSRLTSPTNVEKLKETFRTNPQAARRYAEGIRKHWQALYRQDLDTIQATAERDPQFRLGIEDDGSLFIKSSSPSSTEMDAGFAGFTPTPEISDAQEAIADLNKTFTQTQNALQATGQVDQEGAELHFSLADQVIQLGNGEVHQQLRQERLDRLAQEPTQEGLRAPEGSPTGEGVSPLPEAPVGRSEDFRRFPTPAYPQAGNFGGGRTSGLVPEGGDPYTMATLPESEVPEFLLSLFPVTGEITAVRDAAEAFEAGDAGGAIFAALGAIPGVGITTRLAKKGMGLFEAKRIENKIMSGLQAAKLSPEHSDEINKIVDRYAHEVDVLADKGRNASPEMINAVGLTEARLDTAIEAVEQRTRRTVTPFRPNVTRTSQNPTRGQGELVEHPSKGQAQMRENLRDVVRQLVRTELEKTP